MSFFTLVLSEMISATLKFIDYNVAMTFILIIILIIKEVTCFNFYSGMVFVCKELRIG